MLHSKTCALPTFTPVKPRTNGRTLREARHRKSLDNMVEEQECPGSCGDTMTLSTPRIVEKEVANGCHVEDINGDGPPAAKRLRLDDSEQYFVCDCDILATIDGVVSNLPVEKMFKDDVWKEEVRKFSARLCNIDKLEREFIHIDIAFDKMERDLQKLKEKKSREETALLSPPELHFFDVFVNADRSFKKPETAIARKPPPSLTTHTPRSSGTTAKTSTGLDEIITVGAVGKLTPAPNNLPPEGPIVRKELEISSKVLATRSYPLGVFYKARIIQIQDTKDAGSEPTYRVKYDIRKANMNARALKWYHKRELAYAERCTVILPVGTRVVATYSDESVPPRHSLYAGLIAEPPKPLNKYRYLVFFDDGYAQYVDVDKVYVMCGSSPNVWEDMYRDVREFVRNYLEKYPERPMLRLRKGQTVKTEWNGSWWMARVLTVDSSLVKMSFEADNRTEWIYRGSTRFAPLYTALNQSLQNTAATGGRVRRHNLVPVANKQHRPFVQYTRTLEDEPAKDGGDDDSGEDSAKKAATRNVARKSTTQDRKISDKDDDERNAFGVLLSQAGTREVCRPDVKEGSVYERILYRAHKCAPGCVKDDDPDAHLGKNPLSIPCLLGWERHIVKQSKRSKRRVFYVAPCGRRLRNIDEVVRYLELCKSLLTVDLFCFDSLVNVFCQFVPETVRTFVDDLTYGKEQVPVSCVNSLDEGYPPFVDYSSTRYPGKGVELNLDPDFLCGCDCEDDCQDREKCSCQQLTIAATEALTTGRNPNAGYHNRRLQEPHITGVYECNSQCHCSRRCYNRVVQNGLRARLQIFKTEKRGWGIRCLDDLPQGSFICVYSGQLLNEQAANEDGNQYGDEYLAELDHIEVVEKQKEGYESDVVPASDDDSDESVDEEEAREGISDSDYDSGSADTPRERSSRVRKQRVPPTEDSSDSKANDDEDSTSNDEAQKVNGNGIKEEDNAESKASSKEGSPVKSEKSGDDESWDTKSTEDNKPSDAAGEESQSSTKSESGKIKKQKKRTGNKSSTSKPTSGPLDGPSKGGESQVSKFPPTRSFFKEEFCYIMDAKNCGNIGRYLNHSCSPNVYVQNVFVDTHDLRFPWVAFFAARYIRAGVELTWDYNYDVGSVPERVMYCQCGSDECRGRLI
ncbi:histone-lysine N-methyltransferase SETDB1 isoform X1 [Rhipicephalus sanguineus]|uniref:histone-lysine N-methyltransferase SETDB1 isoform X1 n=2 Tax=Rhipicephalus sanguineus TaxID=34632 RepID=UPI001893194A|nr:histone-lysine N-methyltransferase SETDB1 isoform X1 [Rhipicephalus sanguineus]